MKVIISAPGKFPLGEIVATATAHRRISPEAIAAAIMRHAAGDRGEVCASDAELNNDALKHGDRVLSVYRDGETVFWIITESDRSVTTVLLPEDY